MLAQKTRGALAPARFTLPKLPKWYSIATVKAAWIWNWWTYLAVILVLTGALIWREVRWQAEENQCRGYYTSQSPYWLSPAEQASEQEAIAAACEPASFWHRFLSPSNLPSVLLFLVGLGGIGTAVKTLRVIEVQTRAAKDSADAAKRNIELIVRKERAVIDVKAPLPLDFSKPLEPGRGIYPVNYEVFFHCPTGAVITETDAWADVLAAPWIRNRVVTLPINELPTFVRPEVNSIKCQTWVFVPEPKLEQIEKRESAVHFYGFIKYRNVHMEDSAPDVVLTFHYVWVPEQPVWKVMVSGHWMRFEDYQKWQEDIRRQQEKGS